MRCTKCNKDFESGVKAAYKIGLQDGKNQYIKHLNIIEKTCSELFRQLRVMDIREPDKVNRVYLSRIELCHFAKIFRKHNLPHQALKIEGIIKKQLGKTMSNEAELRKLLEELQE